ncbi:GDSL-type esterase/lipase family protein [Catenovulum sp. 2E275]|uniref:GDSL-type esterase/lipase family protein n=1 Tax=Catenovulum sp. 2E275 TaxID=2980497 RepID=UPI0021D04372|nr:GDSL-type esterase/lipase family protein [Catenovulum sp. 2E275]MCU4677378.1 GDSL-type esterase/lipase family protein [Catenovulum sp. 2E275]
MKKLFSLSAAICGLIISQAHAQPNPAIQANDNLYPTGKVVSHYHNDWTQGHYRNRIKSFKNEPLEFGDIVYIGDSITEKGRDWGKKFQLNQVKNRGIAGDLTDGVLKRLDEITYFKPKAVFILIGVNDLFNLHHKEAGGNFKYDKIVPSVEFIGDNILKIALRIHQQSADTQIYVRTVLPTRRAYLKTDIVKLNSIIKQNEQQGVYQVIDLYQKFVDKNGDMQEELAVDGVHLSDAGYQHWVNVERPILTQL